LLLTLLSGGISTLPINIFRAFVDYAAHPIEVMMPTAHGEQPLLFFMARGIGATNAITYLALCLVLWALVYPAVFLGARKGYGSNEAVLMVLLFAAHPMAYILQTWLGMEDGITVLLTMVLLFSTSSAGLGVASLLLIANHPAALLVVPSIVMLRWLANSAQMTMKHFCFAAAGLVSGKALMMVAIHAFGIQAGSRYQCQTTVPWTDYLRMAVDYFPVRLYTAYYGLWIPVVLMVVLFFNYKRAFYGAYLIFMAVFLASTFFFHDATRDFALLSWAPTLYCLMFTWKIASETEARGRVFRASIVLSALFGWCFPRLFVWNDHIYAPWFSQVFGLIWNRTY